MATDVLFTIVIVCFIINAFSTISTMKEIDLDDEYYM